MPRNDISVRGGGLPHIGSTSGEGYVDLDARVVLWRIILPAPLSKNHRQLDDCKEGQDLIETPPPGRNIMVALTHIPVDDNVPEKYEVDWAVFRLHRNKDRGPSIMSVEHLRT